MMNLLPIILGFYTAVLLIEWGADLLNLKAISPDIPKGFKKLYDSEKYRKSQEYLKENTVFGLLKSGFDFAVFLVFLFSDGFSVLDRFVRGFGYSDLLTGVLYLLVIMLGLYILHLPFQLYHHFGIEAKYGFNQTTFKTFVLDQIKSSFLFALIGLPIMAFLLWTFGKLGASAWWISFLVVSSFQLIMMVVAPIFIMPLFNKFEPLEDGELKTAIETYANAQKFALKGVFTMDGSKRSKKSNAFFVGIGKFRRIVLFDTLIENHSVPELLAVVAHEMGHYKLRHIPRLLFMNLATMAAMFYVLGLFLNSPYIFQAFGVEPSIYIGFSLFSICFSPIQFVIGIFSNALSRKYEFEADRYAAVSTLSPHLLVNALKKLSVDNLGNLTPHPLKVVLTYSHPPVLDRINVLNSYKFE